MTIRIYLRDKFRRRLGEVDDYLQLSLQRRHAGVGYWSLSLSTQSRLAKAFAPGYGIIIERHGVTLASGPVVQFRRDKNVDSDTLTISGYEDTVWLHRRLAFPCPPPFTASTHDARSGTAEDVIKGYVSEAVASGGTRSVPGWVNAPSFQRGRPVRIEARFNELDELCTSIALAGGDLDYRAIQLGDSPDYRPTDIVFDVRQPIDRRGTARFSMEYGNLSSFDYEQSAPEANYILVAGGGEGTARMFLEGSDPASVSEWGRIEGPLRDRRDTIDREQMEQTMVEELSKSAQALSINLSPQDTAQLQYGEDWQLSDLVTVEIDGEGFSELVREESFVWTPDGNERISAVIGSPEAVAPTVPRLFAAQRNTSTRIYQLERRT